MGPKKVQAPPVVEAPVVEKEPEMGPIKVGSFLFPDNSKYEGEYRKIGNKTVRDGKGVYTNGPEQYSGQWNEDVMSGDGEYSFATGAIYKGNFKNNSFEG
jgi:hypothetical protein